MSDSCKLGSVQSGWHFLTALEPGQPLARGHRFTDTEITWNHMGLASALSAENTPEPSVFLYLKAWLQEGKPGSSSPSVERNTAGDCYQGINSQAHAS